MTTLIGIAQNGKVWLGADSCGSYGRIETSVLHSDKIGRLDIGGIPLLYAFTGYVKPRDIVERMVLPADSISAQDTADPARWLRHFFTPELEKHFRECGYLNKSDEGFYHIPGGGGFVLGFAGRVFFVAEDFTVIEPNNKMICLGSGSPYALGALDVIPPQFDPAIRLRAALSAACKFDPYSRPPFQIVSV